MLHTPMHLPATTFALPARIGLDDDMVDWLVIVEKKLDIVGGGGGGGCLYLTFAARRRGRRQS